MKAAVGIFLAGAFAAYLLDPTSGRDRRRRVRAWARPVGRQLSRARDQVAASTTTAQVPPAAKGSQTLRSVASAVQGTVISLSSALAAPARQTAGRDRGAPVASTDHAMTPPSMEAFHTSLAPQPGPADPIPEGETNNPTLVSRVESELFRDDTLPKGRLNIDAANGVVTLRGRVDSAAQADDIVERTRAIEGVADVVDLIQRR